MSTFNPKDKQEEEGWEEEIHSICQHFKNIMLIITNFQTKYIKEHASILKTEDFREIFEDNIIFLSNVLQNLIDVENELIFEKEAADVDKKNISQQ